MRAGKRKGSPDSIPALPFPGDSGAVRKGESVPGPVLNIGNINSRYRFPLPAREFIDRWSKAGPSHHCAIGVGHVAGAIRKYAALLGIPVTVVY